MKLTKQWLVTVAVSYVLLVWPVMAGALSVRTARDCKDQTPAETLEEMFAAIYGCWTPPPDSAGMGVALQFMLLRDGQLKGKIIVSWISPKDDSPARQAFVQSAMDAVQSASPIPLGEALQKTIPGRVLRQKFSSPEVPSMEQDI